MYTVWIPLSYFFLYGFYQSLTTGKCEQQEFTPAFSMAKFDPKWMLDLLIKKRRQNAADHQFLKSNGHGYKLFEKLLDLIGNPYKGGDGWH